MERLNSNCKDEQYAGPLKILAEAVHSGAKLGLEQTQKMLAVLNNPQDKCKSIQIAGTNGKGTCAVTLAAALQTQQKKVGLFTSPHLAHIRERFRINLGAISEEEFSYHFMKC